MSVGQILPYSMVEVQINCTKTAEQLEKISPLVPVENDQDPDLVATHELQKVPTNLPKEGTDEYEKRTVIIDHLEDLTRYFTDTVQHWLGGLDDDCDPEIHKERIQKPLVDYFRKTVWHRKVCAYTRFLDCDAETKKCVCGPQSIYGVEFIPEGKANSYDPQTIEARRCLVNEYELCYIYLKAGTWPELAYPASVRLSYNEAKIAKGSYMMCSFLKDEKTGIISERYQICEESSSSATIIQVPSRATYGLILIWVGWISLCTILNSRSVH